MSKMISIRLSDKLYDDLKNIQKCLGLPISRLIINATVKDILRYKDIKENDVINYYLQH